MARFDMEKDLAKGVIISVKERDIRKKNREERKAFAPETKLR